MAGNACRYISKNGSARSLASAACSGQYSISVVHSQYCEPQSRASPSVRKIEPFHLGGNAPREVQAMW